MLPATASARVSTALAQEVATGPLRRIRTFRDMLFVLKYHIVSVVDSIDATIQVFEREHQ